MLTTLARQRTLFRLGLNGKKTSILALKRCSSTDSHSDQHEHHNDSAVYPEESFNTPFWRGVALTGAVALGLYTLMPLFDEDGTYITRYIQRYRTSSETWNRINSRHLEQSINAAEDVLTTSSALRPAVYRLRHPATMEYASARNVPVGADNVLKDVIVKRDDSWS